MPTKNWTVKIEIANTNENIWFATVIRDDFKFSQKVQGNEGEITQFCKTIRTMYAQHIKDKARAKELEDHFDEILESEDKREADEFVAAVAAAAQAIKDADAAAKEAKAAAKAQAKAEADAKAEAEAALPPPPPEPVTEPTPPDAVPEPIQDAPSTEETNAQNS